MRKRPSLDRAVERRTGIAAHPQAPRLQTKNHADPSESDDPAGVVVPSDQRGPRAPSVLPTRLTSTPYALRHGDPLAFAVLARCETRRREGFNLLLIEQPASNESSEGLFRNHVTRVHIGNVFTPRNRSGP